MTDLPALWAMQRCSASFLLNPTNSSKQSPSAPVVPLVGSDALQGRTQVRALPVSRVLAFCNAIFYWALLQTLAGILLRSVSTSSGSAL
jgi:hypothetical protein